MDEVEQNIEAFHRRVDQLFTCGSLGMMQIIDLRDTEKTIYCKNRVFLILSPFLFCTINFGILDPSASLSCWSKCSRKHKFAFEEPTWFSFNFYSLGYCRNSLRNLAALENKLPCFSRKWARMSRRLFVGNYL